MGSLEELRLNYKLSMSKLMEKFNNTEYGSVESANVLTQIERLHVLIEDVEDKIEKRDALFRKEFVEEADKADRKQEAELMLKREEAKEAARKLEAEEVAKRQAEEKAADRKTNIIVASITGGCGLLGGLIRINRQNSMINTVLDFSRNDDVTGCSKQSLFRSFLGDFFKM